MRGRGAAKQDPLPGLRAEERSAGAESGGGALPRWCDPRRLRGAATIQRMAATLERRDPDGSARLWWRFVSRAERLERRAEACECSLCHGASVTHGIRCIRCAQRNGTEWEVFGIGAENSATPSGGTGEGE